MAVQDPAGSTVLPACIVCLRPCGTPLEVLRRVLGMVGESDSLAVDGRVAAAEGDDGGAPIASCPSCCGPLCSLECSNRCLPHSRLCAHPVAARLRQLAATTSDSVWLAALSVAEVVVAAERASLQHVSPESGPQALQAAQADESAAEHRRRFDNLHTVPWEDIPRWSLGPATAADSAEAADIKRCCRLRRCVVEEVAQLVQAVFPGDQWMAVTSPESISSLMGTMDSSCILPWIRSNDLKDVQIAWVDRRSPVQLAGKRASDAKREVQEIVASIHEAVQRDFEDHAIGLSPSRRRAEDIAERRAEPLWQQGLPPIDGAALYRTGGMMNHSCSPNVDCAWSDSCRATFLANRTIPAGQELCIAYCDPSEPVSKRRRRLLEDFGFICQCELCVVDGGHDVAADEVLCRDSGLTQHKQSDQTVEEAEKVKQEQDDPRSLSKTQEQQRLYAATMRVHAEKFQPVLSGTVSLSATWHEGCTSSGARYWSFTDAGGRARVSFDEPSVSPSEWLQQHDK
eukprot:COSAG03_NODE_15_length_22165_cov_72.809934_21_plen_513_part_00